MSIKKINVFYWTCTGILIPALAIGSVMDVLSDPFSVKIVTDLGYPGYIVPFLGAARLLALLAIVVPGFPRIKEWAYAGLTFDILGAVYSQVACGNAVMNLIFPSGSLLFLAGSYLLYHRKKAMASAAVS